MDAIYKFGAASFVSPRTTMNGARYVELLKAKLELHLHKHQCAIFMHYSAPCHSSKVVQNLLKRINVSTLDWPENIPDLNTGENLWEILKNNVAERTNFK